METITLNHPITVSGVEMKSLQLRRPKVRDRLIVDKLAASDAEKEVLPVANLAEIPREAVEDMDLSDYLKVQKRLTDFFGSETGANSSK